MNPASVMIGMFLAFGGWMLGGLVSGILEDAHERNRIRREWEQQTRKDLNHD